MNLRKYLFIVLSICTFLSFHNFVHADDLQTTEIKILTDNRTAFFEAGQDLEFYEQTFKHSFSYINQDNELISADDLNFKFLIHEINDIYHDLESFYHYFSSQDSTQLRLQVEVSLKNNSSVKSVLKADNNSGFKFYIEDRKQDYNFKHEDKNADFLGFRPSFLEVLSNQSIEYYETALKNSVVVYDENYKVIDNNSLRFEFIFKDRLNNDYFDLETYVNNYSYTQQKRLRVGVRVYKDDVLYICILPENFSKGLNLYTVFNNVETSENNDININYLQKVESDTFESTKNKDVLRLHKTNEVVFQTVDCIFIFIFAVCLTVITYSFYLFLKNKDNFYDEEKFKNDKKP